MSRKPKERTVDCSKAFPRRLCDLMQRNNITQQTLADEVGVTRQSISFYCNGKVSPDMETIVKIARYFGVSSDYLLGLTEMVPQKMTISEAVQMLIEEYEKAKQSTLADVVADPVGFALFRVFRENEGR